MKNYAIVGYPLGHSLSPLIHSMILKGAGVAANYNLCPVSPENFENEFQTRLSKLDGFNVTIPHKITVLPYLNRLDERAALFGAVNTVKNENGFFTGYNTDCYGFLMALKRAKLPLAGKVLLCGSGGVARMIAFECMIAGCDVTIATRESGVEQAEALISEMEKKLGKQAKHCLLNKAEGSFDLIVNGTPVGMFPNVDAMAVSETIVREAGAVYDTVYNPRKTLLVQTAEKYGVPCAGGMDMLVCQAIKAQQIFNGIDPEIVSVDAIIDACYQELEARG